MAKRGRKPLLTADMANQIAAILQRGLPIVDACEATGISEDSYQNWVNKGERLSRLSRPLVPEEQLYVDFFGSCKKARATGKVGLLDAMNQIALNPDHPKQAYAIAWLLERMYPQQFGRRTIRIETDVAELPAVGAMPGGAPEAACNVIIDGAITAVGPVIEEADDEEAAS